VQPANLRSLFARRYSVDPEWLFLSRGADEAIDLLTRVFCAEGKDAVLLTPPAFPMYEHAARVQGAQIVDVPLTAPDFQLDVPAVEAAVAQHRNIKLMMVASPNNPTACLLRRDDLLAVAQVLRGRAVLVVDELYLDYSDATSLATEIADHPNIVVLRSLSKEHSLAGERIGITIAHPTIIGMLRRVSAPYSLTQSSITAASAVASPEGERYSRRRIEQIVSERERVATTMQQLAVVRHVHPSDANFLLVQFVDATSVVAALASAGIRVRDRSTVPGLEGCVRISIGTPEENDAVLDVLRGVEVAR
jgi:histidinol-phosphate aminotransferase